MVKEKTFKQMMEKKLSLLKSGDPFKRIFTVYAMVRERSDEKQPSKRTRRIDKLILTKG